MKYWFSLLFLFALSKVNGQFSRNGSYLKIADSVKAAALYAEATVQVKKSLPRIKAGVSADSISVGLMKHGEHRSVFFSVPPGASNIETAVAVKMHGPNLLWNYTWRDNHSYPLMIMTAYDSAANSTLYSGYIFLSDENKWKLLGTASLTNAPKFIKKIDLQPFTKKNGTYSYSNKWIFRSTGKWMKIDSAASKQPILRPMSNIDSIVQQKTEEEAIRANQATGAEKMEYRSGVFYQLLKEGQGREINLTDTIDVHYKGWLYSNGKTFDQTKEKPASFPLARLIRGWQIGLPGTKVGGKIRLHIPSGSAYGIRTFTADIPPNSILVFDIEVLNTRPQK